ncbi:hypothetical protein SH139x_005071 [Planctomycetaceae bacterium SH139]
MSARRSLGCPLLGVFCSLVLLASIARGDAAYLPDPMVSWIHMEDPEIIMAETELTWPLEFQQLWVTALSSPETDLRREVADSVRQAHAMGMEPIPELINGLADLLKNPQEQERTRVAAAATLAELDAKEYAELLFEQARLGPQMLTLTVEPALARWDYQPIREVWLQRVASGKANHALLKMAIEMLGEIGEPRAVPALRALALPGSRPVTLRLAAARSLARCAQDSGQVLEWSANLLGADSGDAASGDAVSELRVDRIVGAALLSEQDTPAAIDLLERYALCSEGTAAGLAIERLLEVAPARVVANASQLLQNSDSRVRLLTVRGLSTAPSPLAVDQLQPILSDPINSVRVAAREVLLAYAEDPQLTAQVIENAGEVLAADDWRGLEQAILMLTKLEVRDAVDRYFELLDHPRAAVQITAAWSLKTLAIEAWMPRMNQAMEKMGRDLDSAWDPDRTQTFTHLVEAMGMMRHKPAEAFLVELIPKGVPYLPLCRTAAVWSIGFLQEGAIDPGIRDQLEGRLADANSTPPESNEVRAFSAVALGRMKSNESLEMLARWQRVEGSSNFVGRRCAWAVREINGTPIPPLEQKSRTVAGWFLQPLDE